MNSAAEPNPKTTAVRKTPFIDSTQLLMDPAALRTRATEHGYLFFKQRLPKDELLAMRAGMLAIVDKYGW